MLSDIILRIKFTAWIQHIATLSEHFGRQRNIPRNDKVASFYPLHDFAIRYIESHRHLQHMNKT